MDTMQKALDQAIADNVEGVLFHINDGMTKDQAMTSQRKSSCMGDKIWEQIGKAVDAANETVAEVTANELVIEIVEHASDALAGFPYRAGQHIERESSVEIVVDLDDWTGLTTDQERFMDTNDNVLRYDVWSTVS